jgi:hypothetical protein
MIGKYQSFAFFIAHSDWRLLVSGLAKIDAHTSRAPLARAFNSANSSEFPHIKNGKPQYSGCVF